MRTERAGSAMTADHHPPVPEQRSAIADRERDLFLVAGAGTGKTTVLVERFCEVVCATDGPDAGVGVDGVLAFTYTERAAAELKRRIRGELHRRAEDEGDAARGRELRRLAREAESAWISTIHAFCQRVLASQPLAAGLDPRFRVLDEREAGRIAGEAFDAAFERFAAAEGGDRFELAAGFRLAGLREVVRTAHDELRSQAHDPPRMPDLEPPDVAWAIERLRGAAGEALEATEGATRGNAVRNRQLMADALAGTEGRVPTEDEVAGWEFASGARDFACAEVDAYREARKQLECRLAEAEFAPRYELLRELLDLYAGEYERRKAERSALDFEDLQLATLRLLGERPEVRRSYQRQFRHLMIDEFQDTNELQVAIVRLLQAEGGEHRNRLFTVGDELQSIYAFRHADVDVFRRQESATRAAPAAEAGLAELRGNFRSRPGIVALVNRVGRALHGAGYRELTVGVAPVEPKAAGDDPAVEVLVTERKGWEEEGIALDVSPDETAQAWRVAEARFLARRLRELADAGFPRGEMVVLLRSFTHVEAYEDALEMAGLAPYVVGGRGYWSRQQVADLRHLLACVANPLDDFALLGALASPCCGVTPDTLWLLRQAAGGRSIWSAVRGHFGPEPEPAEDEEDAALLAHVPPEDAVALRGFVAELLAVREEATRLPLDALIERAITAVGYDLALLMRPRGRRRMANVRKLMRVAREFEADEGRDLRAFLDFVDAEAGAGGHEAEAAIHVEEHDGVRVMTVHAAKGLEFPLVAVADLGRSVAAGAPPALRVRPTAADPEGARPARPTGMRVGLRLARLGRKGKPILDYERLEQAAVDLGREEERRILHVAMTRAQRKLILSGAVDLEKLPEEPRATEPLLAPVLRALDWRGESAVEIEAPEPREGLGARFDPVQVPVKTCLPTPGEAPPPEPALAAEVRANGEGPPPGRLPDSDLAPPSAAGTGPPVTHVSYSAISQYERCGYRFYVERVLGMRPRRPVTSPATTAPVPDSSEDGGPAEPPTDELLTAGELDSLEHRYARGIVVHELLERSARDGWRAPPSERAAAALRREGAPARPADVDRVLQLVRGFLESELCRELSAARGLRAEAPFAFRLGDLVVRGEIDLIADLGEEVVVIDYKSDALGGDPPEDRMGPYEVQRWLYALAALRRHGRAVRVIYAFLERPDDPVVARFAPDDAEEIAARLTGITGGIAAGRFEVTDRPERALCFDCPARTRLCVHGPELTMRDRADAAPLDAEPARASRGADA